MRGRSCRFTNKKIAMNKAHFVFEYDGKIQGLFENHYITEQTLSRIKLLHVSTIEYLKKVIVASDLKLLIKTIQSN